MSASVLRVHNLAKELNVPSKEIIEKCRAEGIDLKNHMAVVSLGLAESIREWFSAGVDVTSVEVAQPVDLERVVRKPRRRTTKQDESQPPAAADKAEAATAVLETPMPVTETVAAPGRPAVAPPREAVEPSQPVKPIVSQPVEVEEVRTVIPAQPGVPDAPPESDRIAAKAATPVIDEPAPTPPGPLRPPPPPSPPPASVAPAGPQLVPRPAELKGPRLVRIEAPEPVRPPRAWQPPSPYTPPPPLTDVRRGRELPAPPAAKGRAPAAKEDDRDVARARSRSPRRHGNAADISERLREWKDQDVIERKERLAHATGHGLRDRRAAERRRQSAPAPAAPTGRRAPIQVSAPIVLKDLCAAIGMPFATVVRRLMDHNGKVYTINQAIDAETIELLALDLGVPVEIVHRRTALEHLQDARQRMERANLERRPPVVAMLGHVDHGKTSLLDAIRATDVASGEAGGITQHIGAYRIDRGDWHVTFLDTPGHEAFTSMRARGANLTDVVVLVVAATDGVMPQTIEAINHARAASVPIVVALNKIDVPSVDVNRVYAQLSEQGLTPSEWGGTTDVIKTSAVSNIGIDELIAHLSTLSDLLELRADPTVPATATVIDARRRGGHGVVTTVLVREGTLRIGQFFVCGPASGRIRNLLDDHGNRVAEAPPGTPVEVMGLDELPDAGDALYVVDDLATAKEIASEVLASRREASLQLTRKAQSLEELLSAGSANEIPELNAILKADVQGSIDALKKALGDFPSDRARLNILHSGVGTVTEADVSLAQVSRAIIIGFTVVADDRARQAAEQAGVEIRLYRVIYEIIDDLHKALEGLLAPVRKEETRGKAEVKQVFNVSRAGTVAGCRVVDGVIARTHRVRLIRDGRIVVEGAAVASLKRFKDDAREVRSGFECGIKLENYDDLKPGDIIESFEVVEVAQKL